MLATRKRKNIYQHSSKGALKSLIFALNDSAKAFEVRYFRSSQFRRKARKMRGNNIERVKYGLCNFAVYNRQNKQYKTLKQKVHFRDTI